MELQPGGIDARHVVERFVLARREHQHVERRRIARQDAGVDEILLDPQRLGGAILSDRAGIGEIHAAEAREDRKSTRLNSSHSQISYAVFCLKKKKSRTRKCSVQYR